MLGLKGCWVKEVERVGEDVRVKEVEGGWVEDVGGCERVCRKWRWWMEDVGGYGKVLEREREEGKYV